MKLNITELKFFAFCLLNALTINIGIAQNTPIDNLAIQDSIPANKNEFLKTPFGVFNLSQTTGAVFRISGDELRQTAGDNLSEALRGRVPGLRIIRGTNTPGTNGSYSYVLNGGTPYVLIDGQPRGLQTDLREVDEVIVLSDGTFNSLLGNLGDNGLIYVVTKGGKVSKPTVEVNYQSGFNMATRLPELLSAPEYAEIINQASNNDGLGDIYSAEDIAKYKDGSDPINFPNVNSREEFLKSSSPSNFASLNVYGGKEDLKYSAFLGYSDWEGLEKVGNPINGRNITFRTKIDTRINNLLRTHASVYGKFGKNNRPILDADAMFLWISATPANSFPLKVADSAYVVSNEFQTNLLSELENGGLRTDYTANMIFDIGLDFDFEDYIPGLKYDTYLMMRTYNAHTLSTNNNPGLYTLETTQDDVTGEDITNLILYRQDYQNTGIARSNTAIQRNFAYNGNLSYIKEMKESVLNLNLNHLLYYEPSTNSGNPDRRNLTVNLNGSYALKNKYIAFANLNSSSSSKFIGDNRTKYYPTAGIAWVASNEKFLKDNKNIDYLKFRASYGQVGTEYTSTSLFYLSTWGGGKTNSTMYTGIATQTQNQYGYRQSSTANEEIDWIVYNQMFLGVEMSLFKKLRLDFNYFNIDNKNLITNASALFATALGDNIYLPQLNFSERRNKGFNTNVTFNDTRGDFRYHLSVNAGYNKITGEKIAEVPYPDQYRLQQGESIDNFNAYVSDGLFTAENIDDALPQFGDVQIGDIKYVDQNGDNVIDSRDQTTVGNTTPRFNYGVNVGVEYKGINLDIVGMGVGGYDINLNSISYYQHYGLRNYYGSSKNDLPNGNVFPRLSTIQSDNNQQNSDYWLVDGSYFRISNAELGFTLPESLMSKTAITSVKLFLRGSNLALFSKMKDLDPEDTRSGFFEYPMMRTFVFGATVNF
ncbi:MULTISPECIES: SusC/RagA family TonB-linked outer membrane protein [unclassified Polaribacter]|uniref:SusC/RagA family TonB-linked outer membrane protein n=1 Tax=unclassified Polaribacter TaxID=196858 RepID=UPI001C4FB976|nr:MULTISPECIES: SusC/RagA family TonB-linked outer membrane protein [unclassified Polaribacter]QXP63857.1 SusC/RagA family TonB-linked outer membrane protein [Polaribacter sp. HaHaR_3_91]QXP66359.1 SusC/RagA family TonB-linked outer membrane protein [Polaribacter sp. AHE13PA]QXP71854.1 SusC/RagA family TonB-linked outer membrane protein [Polaribacter sp. R2A056_3_33]